jgi:hypothetical protein
MPATNRVHYYHGDACAFGGVFQSPIPQTVAPQASLSLPPSGGYGSSNAGSFNFQNLVSYSAASTVVSGELQSAGWVTYVTATVENLNVLGILTADSLSAQISTIHPLDGDNPTVSFAGTTINNLQISGVKVGLTYNLNICAQTDMDSNGFPVCSCVSDEGFLAQVAAQYRAMTKGTGVPSWITEMYNPANLQDDGCGSVLCSVVSGVSAGSPSSPPPFTSHGNILIVPSLGNVFLGELLVDCKSYQLSALRLQLSGRAQGQHNCSTASANGSTEPPSSPLPTS